MTVRTRLRERIVHFFDDLEQRNRDYYRRWKRAHCYHLWGSTPGREDNSALRTCIKCGIDQHLVGRRFPDIGEPAMWWENKP